MKEIGKDNKGSAMWSFALGLINILLLLGTRLVGPGWYLMAYLFGLGWIALILSIIGFILGLRGTVSSRKSLSAIGAVLCVISVFLMIYFFATSLRGL